MRLTDYKWFAADPIELHSTLPCLIIRRLGLQDYEPIWGAMRYLAEHSKETRSDEIWLLSHRPIYTQGQAGKPEHILHANEIPVVQIDRGGQVTYHGPGQLVAYLLINIRQRKMGVRRLVDVMERAMIATLAECNIRAETWSKAPGVYVNNAKIGALGLRIKNGRSYHGLSLNIKMDLSPFSRINPCGFENLAVTQVSNFKGNEDLSVKEVGKVLCNKLLGELGYKDYY